MTTTARARATVAVVLVGLVAYSAWSRYAILASSDFPIGIDGYYYAVQVRSILEKGSLRFAAAPLAFWYLSAFGALWGPVVGTKVGASLGCAACASGAYLLTKRVTGSVPAALCAAVICALSRGSFLLGAEFVKNGLCITLWMYSSWLILRAERRRSTRDVALAIVSAVAVVLTHKMGALLLLVPVVAVAWGRRASNLALPLVVISTLIGIGAAWPERFSSIRDLAALPRLMSPRAEWDLPALRSGSTAIHLGYEPALGAIIALLTIAALWRRGTEKATSRCVFAYLCCALGLLIALPWWNVSDANGLGFRLRVVAFVPLSLNGGIALAGLLDRLGGARKHPLVSRFAPAFVLCLLLPTSAPEGIVRAHPAMVAAVERLAPLVGSGDRLIVCERQLAFMVAWYTRAEIALRSSDAGDHRQLLLLTLPFIGPGSALERTLDEARSEPRLVPPIGLHELHPNGLVVVTEETWTWCLGQLKPAIRKRYEDWRPR